jgi:hypothetical protein
MGISGACHGSNMIISSMIQKPARSGVTIPKYENPFEPAFRRLFRHFSIDSCLQSR